MPSRRAGAAPAIATSRRTETPVAFLYAEKVVKPEEAPQDWDELLDPKWKKKLIIRDPLASGTMRAVFGFIILRGMKTIG